VLHFRDSLAGHASSLKEGVVCAPGFTDGDLEGSTLKGMVLP
jgi:hypothetical protein